MGVVVFSNQEKLEEVYDLRVEFQFSNSNLEEIKEGCTVRILEGEIN